MITFGFKNRKSIYWRAGASFLLGLSFVIITIALRNSDKGLFDVVVMATGAVLAVTGVFELVSALAGKERAKGEKVRAAIAASGLIILGLVICCLAKFIMTVFCSVLAVALLLSGIYELIVLVSALRVLHFSPAAFILPILVTICGAVVLICALGGNKGLQDLMSYTAGASLMVFSLSELAAMRRIEKAVAAAGPDEQESEVLSPEPVEEQ